MTTAEKIEHARGIVAQIFMDAENPYARMLGEMNTTTLALAKAVALLGDALHEIEARNDVSA